MCLTDHVYISALTITCTPQASNNNQRYAYEPINNGAQLLNSHGLPFSNQTPDILCSPAALPKEPPPDSIRDLVRLC